MLIELRIRGQRPLLPSIIISVVGAHLCASMFVIGAHSCAIVFVAGGRFCRILPPQLLMPHLSIHTTHKYDYQPVYQWHLSGDRGWFFVGGFG